MKKEEFIVGAWYVCKDFVHTQAIRFERFYRDRLVASERIYNGRHVHPHEKLIYHQNLSTYRKVELSEISHYLPSNHPDKLPSINEFPEKGCCLYDPEIEVYVSKALGYTYSEISKRFTYLGWNAKTKSWGTNLTPFNVLPLYDVNQLKQIINPNLNSNGTNNEVQRIETKDRITNPDGAIRMASRRCQVSIGSRPKGNKAPVDIGRTLFKQSEIKPNIVHTRYI
jgi:hypothetical protein